MRSTPLLDSKRARWRTSNMRGCINSLRLCQQTRHRMERTKLNGKKWILRAKHCELCASSANGQGILFRIGFSLMHAR
jgi:hypothetical protein